MTRTELPSLLNVKTLRIHVGEASKRGLSNAAKDLSLAANLSMRSLRYRTTTPPRTSIERTRSELARPLNKMA